MTISRLWQSGAELGVAEFHSYNTQLIQTAGGRTGTYCFRGPGPIPAWNGFVLVPATRQLRVGWAGYTNGTDYDDEIFSSTRGQLPQPVRYPLEPFARGKYAILRQRLVAIHCDRAVAKV